MKKKNKKIKITKKMSFAEVLKEIPEAAEVFMKKGMRCIGCPMAQMESIEDGCKAHDLDVDKVVEEIKKKMRKK